MTVPIKHKTTRQSSLTRQRRAARLRGYVQAFALNLKYQRQRKGLSMRKLAAMAGMSEGTISTLEAGLISPSFYTLLLLADTLKIRPAALFRTDYE